MSTLGQITDGIEEGILRDAAMSQNNKMRSGDHFGFAILSKLAPARTGAMPALAGACS